MRYVLLPEEASRNARWKDEMHPYVYNCTEQNFIPDLNVGHMFAAYVYAASNVEILDSPNVFIINSTFLITIQRTFSLIPSTLGMGMGYPWDSTCSTDIPQISDFRCDIVFEPCFCVCFTIRKINMQHTTYTKVRFRAYSYANISPCEHPIHIPAKYN
jgi:hypothetical protein